MVRSDLGCAGVAFTLDTESGFPEAVVINGSWGLGESVVQGQVVPDKFMVFKPLLDKPGMVPIIEKSLGSKESKYVYRATVGDVSPAGGIDSVAVPAEERGRFVLDDGEVLQLARWCCQIEAHYQRPMDIEWAKDGQSGQLCILQARPETIQAHKPRGLLTRYRLQEQGEWRDRQRRGLRAAGYERQPPVP
jgi:pyruvate,water dikinase